MMVMNKCFQRDCSLRKAEKSQGNYNEHYQVEVYLATTSELRATLGSSDG